VQHSVKLLLIAAVIVATAAGVWWFAAHDNRTANAAEERGQQAQATARSAVPVLAGRASVEDFPIVVRGIGSVQAFNTVTVKSRVDGNIVKVGFVEGQLVRKGELLMQIDPRPYQAQLEQAQANQAKDQANLANARRDLPATPPCCRKNWRRRSSNTTRKKRPSTN